MSKKIDRDASSAFKNDKRFKQSNTKVEGGKMWLFNNLIAEKRKDGIYITNCGWITSTTRNRLNAIGAKIRMQNGKFIYDEKFEWNGDWLKID